jgi:hypothetical protein
MFRKVTHVLHTAILLFFVCGLLGCASFMADRDRRYYSGPLLPSNEVALVYTHPYCQMWGIRSEHENKDKKIAPFGPRLSEFLPGKYVATFHYYDGNKSGGYISLNLNLSAGNIYIVYPQFAGNAFPGYLILEGGATGETWRPIFVNITDYDQEKCMKEETNRSCLNKKPVIEWASKYFQGERRTLTLRKDEYGYSFWE